MFRVGGEEGPGLDHGKEIHEPFIIYHLKDVSPFCNNSNSKCLSYRPAEKSHCFIFSAQVPFTLVANAGERDSP